MPWTIPDKGEGDNDIQSILFQEYLDVVIAGISQTDYVVSGCAVTGGADMTPAVAAGVVVTNGVLKAVTAADATITTADATNPRIDLIVITSAGAIAVRAGTAAAAPKPPARTDNDVVLASVYVAANDTTIGTTCIDDKRVFNKAPEYEMKLTGTYTLTSSTAEQKLFNASTNGRLTLIAGVYEFNSQFSISSMSATIGNAAFDILGAGSAVLTDVLYGAVGSDGATGTAGAQGGSTMVAAQSAAALVTTGTGTVLNAHLKGTFEVTTGGTIVPSVTLLTAAAGVVAAGSFFNCRYKGPSAANTVVGPWN